MARRKQFATEQAAQGSRNKSWGSEMERYVAGLLGDRKWRLHNGSGKTADILVPDRFVFEVKATREPGPAWLQKAAGQRLSGMEEESLPGYIAFTCIDKPSGLRVAWVIEPLDDTWLASKGLVPHGIQHPG